MPSRPAGARDRPSEIEGAALEGLVAEHLRAWADYRGTRRLLIAGALCLPATDFLRRLHAEHPISLAADWADPAG